MDALELAREALRDVPCGCPEQAVPPGCGRDAALKAHVNVVAALEGFRSGPPLASDEGLVRELGQLINQCLARSWRPVFMNGDENSAACLVLALIEERVLGRTPPLPGPK